MVHCLYALSVWHESEVCELISKCWLPAHCYVLDIFSSSLQISTLHGTLSSLMLTISNLQQIRIHIMIIFFCFCYVVIGNSCTITSPCRAGVVSSISGCHNGYIQSYSYPNTYPKNVEWSWYLANPGAATLKLVLLEFNVRKIFGVSHYTAPKHVLAK